MTEPLEKPPEDPDRWTLIRDLLVFQFKLVVDGLRDLLLVPAAFVAAVISLVSGNDGRPGPQFYQLMAFGKKSEHWINLFGGLKNAPPDADSDASFPGGDIDQFVSRVENFVVDEYHRGGMTAQAKERFDKALDVLQRRNSDKT